MRNRTFCFRDRVALLTAVLSPVLATLGGCAGGGGGGRSGSPDGDVYPPLASATIANTGDGVSEVYSLSPDSNQMILTTADISVVPNNSPTPGRITITVSGIPIPGGPEPDFFVTVDPATDLTILENSPLGGSTLSPQCANCLTTGQVQADDGQMVTFLYLDPDSVNLTYSAMGLWSKPTSLGSPNDGTVVGGAFSIGVLTRGSDLPTSGTATYDGFFVGRYATSDTDTMGAPAPGTYAVGANAHGDVDFGGPGSVVFSTLNTNIALEGPGVTLGAPVAAPRLDLLSSPMTIARTATSATFTGNISTDDMSGTISGAFYGRPTTIGTPAAPPELGGALSVVNDANTQSMVGGFTLKRP